MTNRLCGIDPSLTATGLCTVDFDDGVVLDWECIVTKPTPRKKRKNAKPRDKGVRVVPMMSDHIRQMTEMFEGVQAFLQRHPYPIVIEGQTGSSYGGTKAGGMQTFGLGLGYAVCVAACAASGRSPLPITPSVVKRRCGASGIKDSKAAKEYAWQTCRLFFSSFPDPLSSKIKREAVHDAVAVCVASLSLSTDILEDPSP